jgi:hypothetical protein
MQNNQAEFQEQLISKITDVLDVFNNRDRSSLITQQNYEIAGFIMSGIDPLISQREQVVREEALKEYEDRDIEVTLDTKQCLEVAQQVYQGYVEAMKPPVYAFYQFPDWLSRQLESLTTNSEETEAIKRFIR